jgi:hypothetical protein
MRFNKFDEVVSWYERTKPLVSNNHTKEHDVRPIGERRRKWERIKRIDENTYALLDGNYGNTIWGLPNDVTVAYENTMAPITWMRREDGDFIRIRNHAKNGRSVTRYNFLFQHLPNALRFQYNQNGKHWIRHNGEDIVLPKCNVKFDHAKKQLTTDDNMFLMFRANEDGTFTRVGDKLSVEVKRVDKERKKEWRERINAFYLYCATVGPMLDKSWWAQQVYHQQVMEWMRAQHGGNIAGWWIRNAASLPAPLMRDVVGNDEHDLRVAVAAMVVKHITQAHPCPEEAVRRTKSAYNRLMNQTLGFYKIEEV